MSNDYGAERFLREEQLMGLVDGKLIHIDDVDKLTRPKLADIIAITEGRSYLLSQDEEERLLVLVKSDGGWGFIEDSPATLDEENRPEQYKAIVLDNAALESLAKLIAPLVRNRRESSGRPPKYSVGEEGGYIFFQHIYMGQSIKSLAAEFKMSPTTVQKLLNIARREAADNIVEGNLDMSPDSPNFFKHLKILKWAMEHSESPVKEVYGEFLNKFLTETGQKIENL